MYEYSSEYHFSEVCPVFECSRQWKLLVINILTVAGRGLQSSNRPRPRRRGSKSAVLSGEALHRSLCHHRRASPEW